MRHDLKIFEPMLHMLPPLSTSGLGMHQMLLKMLTHFPRRICYQGATFNFGRKRVDELGKRSVALAASRTAHLEGMWKKNICGRALRSRSPAM